MKNQPLVKSAMASSAASRSGPLHTVRQTAEYLGVCDRTVRRLIAVGDLLSHRIGRSVRVSEADLRAYFARSR
jgi:excisionase family DNA binding protein